MLAEQLVRFAASQDQKFAQTVIGNLRNVLGKIADELEAAGEVLEGLHHLRVEAVGNLRLDGHHEPLADDLNHVL